MTEKVESELDFNGRLQTMTSCSRGFSVHFLHRPSPDFQMTTLGSKSHLHVHFVYCRVDFLISGALLSISSLGLFGAPGNSTPPPGSTAVMKAS